ncbi:hypothetical protein BJ165DRAFT_1409679 [Panaeolus papilionaceus]|nr:hypothetical protein BJ165DRAFT_1409679 [Panaeolus papilionaceus]
MTSKQHKQPRPRIELFPVPMLSIHNSSNRDSDSNGSEFDPIINRSSSPASIPEPIASQHRQAQAKERQFERQLATRQQRGLGADIGNTLASNSMGGRDTKSKPASSSSKRHLEDISNRDGNRASKRQHTTTSPCPSEMKNLAQLIQYEVSEVRKVIERSAEEARKDRQELVGVLRDLLHEVQNES